MKISEAIEKIKEIESNIHILESKICKHLTELEEIQKEVFGVSGGDQISIDAMVTLIQRVIEDGKNEN